MTQAELLPFHGKGVQILLGCNPDDLSAPALAFDADGRLICQGIAFVERGAYVSVDSIRAAARNKKATRDAVAKAEAANNDMATQEFDAALAALDDVIDVPEPPKQQKVVGGRFGGPLRETIAAPASDTDPDTVPLDFLRNMDANLTQKRAKGRKLA